MDVNASLRYYDYQIKRDEVPGERSLLVFLTCCPHRCSECHTPWLWEHDGDFLNEILPHVISLYRAKITCVCFMGEGRGSEMDIEELIHWCTFIQSLGLKTALYTGKDGNPVSWMNGFDFVKTGRYVKELGPLSNPSTNQRFYRRVKDAWTDETNQFR